MAETRDVFDISHSSPVTHSFFLVLCESLAKAKRFGAYHMHGAETQPSAVAFSHKGVGVGPGFMFLPLSGQELQSSNTGLSTLIV